MKNQVGTATIEENTLPKTPLPNWKKWFLGIALLFGVIGVVMYGITFLTNNNESQIVSVPEQDTPGMRIQSIPPSSFAPDSFNSDYPMPNQEQQWPAPEQIGIDMGDWSTLFMKLGFSFVVGFAIAYALSSFLKLGLIIMGSAFLLLFGLQYAGLIDVNWQNMSDHYDAFIVWLQPHIGSFREFITSNLPSSVLAGAGLVMGFRF